MTARRLSGQRVWIASAAVVATLALVGCGGQTATQRTPTVDKLPLIPGAHISLRVQRCDMGANAFCGWELLVIAPRYRSSDDVVKSEHRLLMKSGWTGADADAGEQRAADSPGHKLRVTYATPSADLIGIDQGSTKRSRKLTLALSQAIFNRQSAMSMLLEVGAS
jgi:hypothetical protein